MLSPRNAPPIVTLALASILAVALALVTLSSAHAKGADVQIKQLDCEGNPERLVIENVGDANQNLAGWKVVSDPSSSEAFDLSTLGTVLVAGATNTVESGPSASATFIWSLNEIYRDNDSTDYARILDDTGATVDQVSCGVAATPTPTPTATPEASGVPNGGGPPPSVAGAVPALVLLLGGSIAVLGAGTAALPFLRRRSSTTAAAPSAQADPPSSRRVSTIAVLALVSLIAAVALLLLLPSDA